MLLQAITTPCFLGRIITIIIRITKTITITTINI